MKDVMLEKSVSRNGGNEKECFDVSQIWTSMQDANESSTRLKIATHAYSAIRYNHVLSRWQPSK
jgi:hypothetical protein